MKHIILSIFLIVPLLSFSQETIRVFFLGGQSNMAGYGYSKDLPDSLNQPLEDVYIFHGHPANDGENGGAGVWELLQPGHGEGFASTDKGNDRSDRFGLELSFAATMKAQYPNDLIALIKYAKGGSSIDTLGAPQFGTWDPDFSQPNQYDHFLATLNNALATQDLNKDGEQDVLIPSGILWMQGESDAGSAEVAARYEQHLKRLMDLIRAAMRVDDLPVVIGKISDSWNPKYDGKVWKHGELVQYAQEQFVKKDERAAIVRQTRYYDYSDPWHYTSADYLDMGVRFADEMIQLLEDTP